MRIPVVLMCVAFIVISCHGVRPVKKVIYLKNPFVANADSSEGVPANKDILSHLWEVARERSLHDSISVLLPHGEAGYFKSNEPDARSYSFIIKEGQVLTIDGYQNGGDATIFLDLFVKRGKDWKSLIHTDSFFSVSHEFAHNDTCLLRLQPRLLSDVYYTIGISLTPVLINPVAGASNKSIGSFYGASRDGGQRSHEGVDIFAKKGTPVVAPTDGQISKVSTSKLGGKVIWLQDSKRGHAYYFAHLDRQLVKTGARVTQGDTIGTVGNTGNARNTASHLHFGIYQTRSKSKDPIDYIRTLEAVADALPWDTTLNLREFKVGDKAIPFRQRPDENGFVRDILQKGTYVKVVAQTMHAYRIRLPDGREGFVDEHTLIPLKGGKKVRVRSSKTLYRDVTHSAPVAHLDPSTVVQVLAHFKSHKYVITREGVMGWLIL